MAYLDYVGLAYFKNLLDENYLRTDYSGDTTIQGNVTFTEPVDADVKNDYLGNQIDKTYIKNLRPEDDGEVALIYGDNHEEVITIDTAVTQVRSDANEMYPILLCYDANAEVNQISKSVRYGHNVAINPAYGYVYANSYVVKHPTYNRTISPTTRVEWANDFRDSVLNPVGQVFEYIDPVSSGGEHRMEFRLYGNPNVAGINTPNVNDETNTISMGVSATRGDTLTFFGYCPSTPIYLENGSTMRKSLTRGDQYGRDIITRDWLNLNGSITGLVHTYMDETIDGSKTFKKTVTINSGDNNNKAGLYVQGNSDIHGNEHVYGTETVDEKLTVNGTAEINGGSGNTPSLTVTGNEKVTGNSTVDGNSSVGGNSTITGNETVGGNISTTNGNISTTNGTVSGKTGSIGSGGLTVAGNETVTGKITGNGGAEISGGNGLKVNGNETVTGNISAAGNISTNGTITKVVNNTPVEYVTYVTNQPEVREALSENILALGKGLNKDSTGKIYVDFSQIDANTKAAILAGLNIQVPITSDVVLYVNPGASNDTDNQTLQYSTRIATPFTTIQGAVNWATTNLAINSHTVYIKIYAGTYAEAIELPSMNRSSGQMILDSMSGNKDVIIRPSTNNNARVPDFCIQTIAGPSVWVLHNLVCRIDLCNNDVAGKTTGCIRAGHDGAQLNIRNCDTIVSPVANSLSGTEYGVRVFDASDGGIISFLPSTSNSSMSCTLPSTNRDVIISVSVLHACRNGAIRFVRTASGSYGDYACQGSCDYFINLWQNASISVGGAGDVQPKFVLASGKTLTGQKYWVRSGSNGVLPAPALGTVEGTVEAVSYCWLAEPSS